MPQGWVPDEVEGSAKTTVTQTSFREALKNQVNDENKGDNDFVRGIKLPNTLQASIGIGKSRVPRTMASSSVDCPGQKQVRYLQPSKQVLYKLVRQQVNKAGNPSRSMPGFLTRCRIGRGDGYPHLIPRAVHGQVHTEERAR